MKLKFKNIISNFLILCLLSESAVFANSVEELETKSQQIQKLDSSEFARESLGGKIVNKLDGAEIYLECVESNADGSCKSAQYVYKYGIGKKELTSVFEMKELIDQFEIFKSKLQEAINSKVSALKEKRGSFNAMPITVALVDDAHFGTGMSIGAVGGLIIAMTGILIGTGPIGWAIFFGCILWAPLTDAIIMAPRLAAHGVKTVVMKIKIRKLKKSMKRISKALEISLHEGNRTATLKAKDFEFLRSVLSQLAPVEQPSELK